MSNIGNEFGQVLNSVLTTGEGAGLDDLCQGIVQRYRDAGEEFRNSSRITPTILSNEKKTKPILVQLI